MTNQVARNKRHKRIRAKISGTDTKPRLSVYRSLNFVYAQLIDDTKGIVLAQSSDIKNRGKLSKIDSASKVGETIAKLAQEKKITTCVFDRGGYKFHGRIKALAEAARENGLKF